MSLPPQYQDPKHVPAITLHFYVGSKELDSGSGAHKATPYLLNNLHSSLGTLSWWSVCKAPAWKQKASPVLPGPEDSLFRLEALSL